MRANDVVVAHRSWGRRTQDKCLAHLSLTSSMSKGSCSQKGRVSRNARGTLYLSMKGQYDNLSSTGEPLTGGAGNYYRDMILGNKMSTFYRPLWKPSFIPFWKSEAFAMKAIHTFGACSGCCSRGPARCSQGLDISIHSRAWPRLCNRERKENKDGGGEWN